MAIQLHRGSTGPQEETFDPWKRDKGIEIARLLRRYCNCRVRFTHPRHRRRRLRTISNVEQFALNEVGWFVK